MPARQALFGFWPCVVVMALCAPVPGRAADANAVDAAALDQIVQNLNADQFHLRHQAAEAIQQLAEQSAAKPLLADRLSRLLLATETSYEVRALCEPLLLRLPPPSAELAAVSPTEIDPLLQQVDGPSYAQRVGAAVRLAWIAQRHPESAYALVGKLQARLADRDLSADSRRRLEQVRETAWVEWLATDPATWPQPSATIDQARGWITALIAEKTPAIERDSAERALIDLLAYEEWTPRISELLAEQLKTENLAPDTFERLTRLYELSRPALAAEIWEDHVHRTVQYLLVDVPQHPEGMPRATHFDRIDEETAHCVSGNSLSPGDYPVGVAIPPTHNFPELEKHKRMFHLVNLPTARRRLLYDHRQLHVDEAVRLRELSERTTAWFLKRSQCLTDREIAMLRQLDATVVSRFVGPYLLAVDDQPKLEPDDFPAGGRNSRHALLCTVLIEIGTPAALPGLVDASRRGRFPKPNDELPYHIGWLAALSVAERNPWPGRDEWLATLIDSEQPLSITTDPPPEVGATAAAMLLVHQGGAPAEFGIVDVNDLDLRGLSIPASRFTTAEGRKLVLAWWERQKQRGKGTGA